jgi:formylglycine-generating enzyme required for sulfatase activity
VTIGRPFAVGKLHVTVNQFAAFVRETGYEASADCWTWEGNGLSLWRRRSDRSWRNPGFAQEASHPAVCLSWNDAKAYADWVAGKTGKSYRLLSEAEWEYAARGRTSPSADPRFWFGDDEKVLCRYGNVWDEDAKEYSERLFRWLEWMPLADPGSRGIRWLFATCHDGYIYTSPTGHYPPNAFGLYDMFGNAWQWTADCWHGDYKGAPADGSAWTTGCTPSGRVGRGGSWLQISNHWIPITGSIIAPTGQPSVASATLRAAMLVCGWLGRSPLERFASSGQASWSLLWSGDQNVWALRRLGITSSSSGWFSKNSSAAAVRPHGK